MPIASDDLRLFGLDLRNLWHDLRTPWGKLMRTPAWAWLSPRVQIQVTGADGQARSVWEPDARIRGFRFKSGVAQENAVQDAPTGFQAVLLPESLLLRKRLPMPQLDSEKMLQALSLEAANSNPFASSSLIWGYALNPDVATGTPGLVNVEMVLASRQRVEQYLSTLNMFGVDVEPEVWATLPQRTDAAMLVPGFGEARRARSGQRYWATVGILAGVVAALCIAIALTPLLQLRARALQANVAYAALDKAAGPQVGKREGLVKIEDQVKALADIIGHRLDTLQVVQALTKALPDDTVLQRLQIEGRKVMIGGQTSDSASLMQKLGAMPEIKEVRAPSPAVRQPGMVKETFQIEFQLTDDFGVLPSDAATAAALAPANPASAAQAPASAASAPVAAAPVAPAASGPAATPVAPSAPAPARAAPVPAPPSPAGKGATSVTETIGGS